MSFLGAAPAAVFPPYSGGKRIYLSVLIGFSTAASTPGDAKGGASAFVGVQRLGYAIGDRGLEVFAGIAGNLAGPGALWFDLGGRWMFSPLVKTNAKGQRESLDLHVGPEVFLGPFRRLGSTINAPGVTYEAEGSTHFAFGASLDVALGVTPALKLEAALGNLRIVPTSEGAIVLLGATAGATYRF